MLVPSRQLLRPLAAIAISLTLALLFVFSSVDVDMSNKQYSAVGYNLPSPREKSKYNNRRPMSSSERDDLLRRDLGLALQNDSAAAIEAFFAGEREREIAKRRRKRNSGELSLSNSLSLSVPMTNATDKQICNLPIPGSNRSECDSSFLRVDLVVYILFQREINGHLYSGINWKWLPRLDNGMTAASTSPNTDPKPEGVRDLTDAPFKSSAADAIVGDDTDRIVHHLRGEHQERDRTRIAFVAVNPHIKKSFRLLPSQVSGSLRRRLLGSNTKAKFALERELKGGIASDGFVDSSAPGTRDIYTVSSQLLTVKGSHLPKTILHGRLLKEWRMPGYSSGLGFAGEDPHNDTQLENDQPDGESNFATEVSSGVKSRGLIERRNAIIHHLDEFGTMRTLYRSGLTFLHSNVAGEDTKGNNNQRRNLAADADGDGVQEWIGFFPSDVRIDLRLFQLIRRRIRQGTSRYLGRNITFDIGGVPTKMQTSQSPPKKKRNAGAYFKGRIVGGAVINSDSVNRQRTLPPLPDAYAPDIHLPANHHCCIFFSGSYPSIYLFNNALGQQLLVLYNAYFSKEITFEYLTRPNAPDAILESFVIPNALFNKLFPFVDHIIHMLVVDNKEFASPEVPPVTSSDSVVSSIEEVATLDEEWQSNRVAKPTVASPTEVLERALALVLVLEPMWLRIRLPVRHARDF